VHAEGSRCGATKGLSDRPLEPFGRLPFA